MEGCFFFRAIWPTVRPSMPDRQALVGLVEFDAADHVSDSTSSK
jgi:hypothetical protein